MLFCIPSPPTQKFLLVKKLAVLALILVTSAFSAPVFAQDFSFSQYFNFAPTTNPANTGYYRQDYRAGVIHRRQWQQIGNPFLTSGVFADFNFKPNSFKGVPKEGAPQIGVGVYFVNDQLGNGIYRANHIMGSVSYIKPFGEYYRHTIAFGFQAGYYQKGINSDGLYFEDQFSPQRTPDLPTREQVLNNSQNTLNLNAGVNYSLLLSKKVNMTVGASAFNLLEPKEQFLTGVVNSETPSLKRRYFGTFNMQIQLTPKMFLSPMAMYQSQGAAREITAGVNFANQFNKATNKKGLSNPDQIVGYLGLFYRLNDALIPYVGLRYKNITGGISYDVNVSGLSGAENGATPTNRPRVRTLEISLLYSGFWDPKTPSRQSIPCKDYY